jgi:hypothetical protein
LEYINRGRSRRDRIKSNRKDSYSKAKVNRSLGLKVINEKRFF